MQHKCFAGEASRFMRLAVALGALSVCVAAHAAEYFVSKERPDDSGDGTSIATAKRTIQAAVDIAKNGDIVTVLPGIYDEGEASYVSVAIGNKETSARVVLPRSIWLRSLEGKEKTFIVGSRLADGGKKDLRCVALATSSTIVEGFTLCGGTATDSYGGGVLAEAWGEYFVADCIITNNVAAEGAGACRGALVRCLLENNTATKNSSACRQSKAIHSVIRHNHGPRSTHAYCYGFYNCTVFENTTDTSENYQYANLPLYNCLYAGNTGFLDASKCYFVMSNCVVDRPASEFSDPSECVFEPDIHQFLAPIFDDLRLLKGSVSATAGKAEWLEEFSFKTTAVPEWGELLDTKYRYADFFGNPIPKTGAIACGAIQSVVEPASGRVDFGGVSTASWGSPGIEGKKSRCYAYAESYPTQFCVKAEFDSGKNLFMYQFDPMYDLYCFFPEMDGYFRFVPPPQGSSVTLNPVVATYELYADAENGDDANDGSSPEKAFKTLQAAINAASGGYYDRTLIHAAPGHYDQGGNFAGSLSNRIDNLSKTLYIRAEEGPEKTFIVGAPDPDTKGLGPNAVRCVKWYHGGRIGCLQGFTLTGGYTDDGTSYAESRIVAGYYGSFEHISDCIISNNHAVCAVASMYGIFSRCRISDNIAKVSWVVSSPKSMSYCLVNDNMILAGADANVTRGGCYRFCTIDGAGFATVNANLAGSYYGCIFERTGSTFENCVFEDCFAASDPSQTEIPGITVCDPCMVGGDDRRLLSTSPAYGAVSLENPAWHYSYFSSDLSGCSPYWKGATMTAGAYSRPLQAFSVKGPKDALSHTGTNGVEFAETVVVTAQAKRPRNGAKFLGFTVNGERLPAEQLTYELSGAEPDGIIEIIADYLPVGLKMFFR